LVILTVCDGYPRAANRDTGLMADWPAAPGEEQWNFDLKVDHNTPFSTVASRGVALWHDASQGRLGVCASDRVLVATLDRGLIDLGVWLTEQYKNLDESSVGEDLPGYVPR
jgi:hypothetical protein